MKVKLCINKTRHLAIICLFLIGKHSAHSESKSEPPCKLKDGSKGTCKFLSECQSAKDALKKSIFPEICGFIGTMTIVCCKTITSFNPIVIPSVPGELRKSSGTEQHTTANKVGKISKAKCLEYSKYAWEEQQSDTLSLMTQLTKTLDCAFDIQQMISGGTPAVVKEFPHMAQIGFKYDRSELISWDCGGSLISERFVLTAAHCVQHQDSSPKYVRTGITVLTDKAHMQQRAVAEVYPHPQYEPGKHYHDIGLLRLARPFEMNPYARPACLFDGKVISQTQVIASGWGAIGYFADPSPSLLKVVLELYGPIECNRTYRRVMMEYGSKLSRGIVDDMMICAGSSKDLKDTCRGDSGGPLQIYHEDTEDIKCMYEIIGVTSFGKGCGLAKNNPGVYTRVSNYLQWIESIVWLE
ncbi:unnamed protein product [Phaedon cochleariae]|uniref:Peptidase S1 domain-containing protein n=1 Tax=Phaedon cochleariae TaxID=80249 RepID=A0A9N9X4P5_PHACE|nr:unnamed protein product [Phaedon cochleariae]